MKNFFEDNKYAVSWGILGVVALSVFGSLFLIAKTVGEIKQIGQNTSPYYNSISMTGTGEVVSIPDIASFNFSVNEVSESVDSAQKIATEKINKTLDYLKTQGVDEKDIKTTSYNINPRYEWRRGICNELVCDSGENKLIGYEVSQTIDIKIRDTKKAGEILAGIGGFGISNVSGLNFTTDDPEVLKEEARVKAIADARQKAEAVGKELGVRIVKVVSFYEETENPVYGMGGDAVMEAKVSVAPAPELPKGENKIISKVSVTFEIR